MAIFMSAVHPLSPFQGHGAGEQSATGSESACKVNFKHADSLEAPLPSCSFLFALKGGTLVVVVVASLDEHTTSCDAHKDG